MTRIQKLKHNMIGDKAFYKQVLTVLIPIIIQQTVTNVVSLVDNVMVGAVGTLEMSAVAIINQLLLIFMLSIFGAGAGVGIFTSQYVGAGDKDGVRNCFKMKMYFGLFIFVVATAVLLIFPNQLINSYIADNTSPADATATMKFAKEYLYVMLIGFLPFVISQAYGGILRETGETKVPMLASVIAIILNTVFNYILIFGNKGLPFLPFEPLGVVGAAAATSFSRFVEMLIMIVYTHKNAKKYDYIIGVYRSLKVPFAFFINILKKGAPLIANEFLWSAGMAMVMQCYSLRGIEVVAATNISNTILNLFKAIYMSIGLSIGILAGQQLGANKIEEAKTTVWRILTLDTIAAIISALMLAVVAPFIPKVYNTTEAVQWMATELLWVQAVMTPFSAFGLGGYFTMRSGGKTLITTIFDGGFVWYMNYPLALIIGHLTNMDIVPFTLLVQSMDVLKAIAAFILVKNGFWAKNIVAKNRRIIDKVKKY